MGVFSRFADIVNSNINALLDKAEDPEKMVRMIIQEMEDTLVEVRSTSARTIADKKELVRRVDRFKAEVNDWQDKAELAISKDREDLARAALTEKQKAEEAVETLSNELQLLEDQLSKLQSEIATLQEKLKDAKTRQKAMIARRQTAKSRLDVKKQLDSSKVDDAMNRFERYERKIDDIESQVEAYDMGKRDLADEFADLQKEDSVEDELAALKAKMNASKAKKSAK